MESTYFHYIPIEINIIIIEYIDIIRDYIPLSVIVKPILNISHHFLIAFRKYINLVKRGIINHFKSINYEKYRQAAHSFWNPLTPFLIRDTIKYLYNIINYGSKEYKMNSQGIVIGDEEIVNNIGSSFSYILYSKYNFTWKEARNLQFVYAIYEENFLDISADLKKYVTYIISFKGEYYKYKIFYHYEKPITRISDKYNNWKSLINSLKDDPILDKMLIINGYTY